MSRKIKNSKSMSSGHEDRSLEKIRAMDKSLREIRLVLEKRADNARKSLNEASDDARRQNKLKKLQLELDAFDTLVVTCFTLGEEVNALRDVVETLLDDEEDDEGMADLDDVQENTAQTIKYKN
jgi:hypothetical protein